MKKILLLSLLYINNVSAKPFDGKSNFSIKIWNYNYSMALITLYCLDSDSITIKAISGIEGEGEKIIMRRALKGFEYKELYDFISTLKISNLKNKYSNPLVADGDQKKVEFYFNKKIKTIEISNVYLNSMSKLFNIVNKIVDDKLKIHYSKTD